MGAGTPRTALGIVKAALAGWQADRVPRLAAALTYHTLFALAPLLVLSAGVAGLLLGPSATRERLVAQVLGYTGSPEIAALVGSIVDQAARPSASRLATAAGAAMLLWGASNVFRELKLALNDIWGAPRRRARPVAGFLLDRALALLMVVIAGGLLLGSLVASTWLASAARRLAAGVGAQVVAFAGIYLLTVVIFAAIYRYVPDVRIARRHAWGGAAVTALLFSAGRLLLSLYLSRSTAGSAYGAAGTLVVVLLWVYYSAQIFFFGAELTRVLARTRE